MLNHITIMGRLTRDPELRKTGSGVAVTSFTLAVDRDRAAEGQEKETDFIDCVAWRQAGEFVAKYFTKGRMAVVSGRLQIRNWTDKDGNKRRAAEVIAENVYFGDSKRDDNQGGGQQSAPQQGGYQPQGGYQQPAPQQGGYQPQGGYQQPAPQQGGYQPQGGYQQPAPQQGSYQPQGGYQQPAPQQGGYPANYGGMAGYAGYGAAPGGDFAPLDGDDAQLPF